jgi:hypothetical protein
MSAAAPQDEEHDIPEVGVCLLELSGEGTDESREDADCERCPNDNELERRQLALLQPPVQLIHRHATDRDERSDVSTGRSGSDMKWAQSSCGAIAASRLRELSIDKSTI